MNNTQSLKDTALAAEADYLHAVDTDEEFDKLDAYDTALTDLTVHHMITAEYPKLTSIDVERVTLDILHLMTGPVDSSEQLPEMDMLDAFHPAFVSIIANAVNVSFASAVILH